MSETQLREMLQKASKFCEDHLRAKGCVLPMYHAVTRDGRELVQPPPASDKDVSIALLKALFELEDVVRYIFIDEAWTLSVTDDLTPSAIERLKAEVSRIGLRNHPKRQEMVLLQGEDVDYGGICWQRPLIRPTSGKPYLGPIDPIQDASMPGGRQAVSGRMFGLLPIKATRH